MTANFRIKEPNIILIIILCLLLVMIGQKLFGQTPEKEFLASINSYRAKHLAPKLEYREENQELLTAVARANEKNYCHCHSGYYKEEIITKTITTENAMESFMYSRPHKRSMLKRSHRRATVGMYQAEKYLYVVVRFYN